MSIPIFIFLILYLFVVLIFLIFTFFNIYHSWRFGMNSFTNFFSIFIYLSALAVIFFFSYNFIKTIDWTASINIL
ncbi:hypothetical protein COX27_01160 [Candidatus Kuenenbacteria bacterium CG23_combo_of_CG06-09_8_20_14_all_36_9]|uniref:Uncharacterized protein n=1 Tax=Candidatus Kuenenbacteria bacterium CG10_big_fil_rev_8_21_14_0_10_36_11 TaxID=1974618 RepID=A0A2M6WB84_9BACT|nr:MAG: hypothetical protein COX27_01160 [Candidatus Kuenenbacteria bacterium CG23_combo_of_CG06-09_8_20_14_all_36_9]PIT90046.1 MAG: hypothetical protein COU23_00695 [Candidatus Kuenenbacteria bacterium CG10_big_fil_rev_8_21_14_0_10_36_11]